MSPEEINIILTHCEEILGPWEQRRENLNEPATIVRSRKCYNFGSILSNNKKSNDPQEDLKWIEKECKMMLAKISRGIISN